GAGGGGASAVVPPGGGKPSPPGAGRKGKRHLRYRRTVRRRTSRDERRGHPHGRDCNEDAEKAQNDGPALVSGRGAAPGRVLDPCPTHLADSSQMSVRSRERM